MRRKRSGTNMQTERRRRTENLSGIEAKLCKWTDRVESKLLSLLPDSDPITACENIHCAVMFGAELGSCSLFALSHAHRRETEQIT